jgi:hypothetical protein
VLFLIDGNPSWVVVIFGTLAAFLTQPRHKTITEPVNTPTLYLVGTDNPYQILPSQTAA